MNAKKKLLISLASFALVLVFAVVSALALRTVKIQSKSYSIQFRASAVRATFTMKTTYYKALGESTVGNVTTDPTVHTSGAELGEYDFEEIELLEQTITVDNNGAYIGTPADAGAAVSGTTGEVTTDSSGRRQQGYTVDEINLLGADADAAAEAATLASNSYGRTGVLKFEFTATSTSDTSITYQFVNSFTHANLGCLVLCNVEVDNETGDLVLVDEGFAARTAFTANFTTLGEKKDSVDSDTIDNEDGFTFNGGSGENAGKSCKVVVYVYVLDPAVDTTYTPAGDAAPFTFSAWLADTEKQ